LSAIQFLANYVWNTLALGQGGSVNGPNANNNASTADFFFFDSQAPMSIFNGDYLRNGTTQSSNPGPSNVVSDIQAAQVALAAAFRSVSGGKKIFINQALPSAAAVGATFPSGVGVFDGAMQQFLFGQGVSAAYENFGGFTGAMNAMVTQIAGGSQYVLLTNAMIDVTTASGLQYARYALASHCMDVGYFLAGSKAYGNSIGNTACDFSDGSQSSTFVLMDEYSGGSLATHWWLGARANPNGVVNSNGVSTALTDSNGNDVAWQNGCYRADFANGIVIVNASSSAQSVTTETTYHRLLATVNTGISGNPNTGAAGTSFTLQSKDAIFLSRTAVPGGS
jgi:hypothetical protein